MGWIEISISVIGAIGGVTGLISLYHAKSKKQTIDISNMSAMLEEAHKMYDEVNKEREEVAADYRAYKEETMRYIGEFKERFAVLEKRLDKAEDDVLKLKRSIYQGYRCRYPAKIEDCPVIKEYEKAHCENCIEEKE